MPPARAPRPPATAGWTLCWAARLLVALCILSGFIAEAMAEGAAGRRVALVIGNAAYAESPLRNPINDARAMAEVLKQRGFEVILRENTSKLDLERSVADFGEKLNQGATGLFYYAGHGMQVNGRNFLIPVDAQIPSEQRVRLEAVDIDVVLEQMQAARSTVNLVILDACRNNPFERRFRSGGGGGLAQINAPEGTLIAYATSPGRVAADGEGRHSLYTEELLKAMQAPGTKVEDVFKTVRVAVSRRSNGAQTPWEASSLTGDFFFVPTVARVGSPTGPSQAAPVVEPAPGPNRATLELAFWDSVKGSNNPAELQAYLVQFPEGTFAPLAKARIAALTAPQPAPAPAAPPQQLAALPPAQAPVPRPAMQTAPGESGFPRKPITIVVPFPPGGGADTAARTVAASMTRALNQSVIIENRPGAGGAVGAQHVIAGARDGYTLLLGTSTTLAMSPVPPNPGVDLSALAAVGGIHQTPLVLVVSNSLPVRSVAELAAYLKANPQRVSYASTGEGTPSAVMGAAFAAAVGAAIPHVPYRASAQALSDVMSGHATLFFADTATAASQAAGGAMRVMASAAPQRLAQWPDAPTLGELGLGGFDAAVWSGLFVPRDVAPQTIDTLSRALAAALQDASVVGALRSMGATPLPLDAAAMEARLAADRRQWQALVSRAASR